MNYVPYVYVRSLELEDRPPSDIGQWSVTNMRLLYLEGLPDLDEHMVPIKQDGTFANTPPELRRSFWNRRTRFYRRIRSADEASRLLKLRSHDDITKVCLPLFASWVDPPDGVIPMPSPGEREAPETHAITLLDAIRLGGTEVEGVPDAEHFLFRNTWGPQWGHQGMGLLPFAYYNKYGFEQWVESNDNDLRRFRLKRLKPDWWSWQSWDEFDRRVYAFEAGDPQKERLGWAFMIETQDAVELEELFVAPEARGKGVGSELARLVSGLVAAKKMPLRIWVPFADTIQESPRTAGALPHLAKRLGVEFHRSPVPWAAYFATSELPGSLTPVEPEHMPGRPKSTMGALAAFAASVGVAISVPQTVTATPPITRTAPGAVLTIDSPEWAAMNSRRVALIYKKHRDRLDPAEVTELESLQSTADALVEAASPRPALYAPDLEAKLAAKASN